MGTRTRITAEQYRHLPETNRHQELIEGAIIVTPSPKDIHQDVVLNLAFLLREHAPHGKTVIAPMDVYLDEVNVVQPDVFWLAPDGNCRSQKDYYHGPPELVVEVLSAATSTRDRRDKFMLYQQHGVREYWVADPNGQNLEVWTQGEDGFRRVGLYVEGDRFDSVPLAQTVTLSGVFPPEEAPEDEVSEE
jgi:Uma2 family endonuclease